MTDPVTRRLLASRVELLDLSLRNPLLNYRGSTRRGVDIIDEKSSQIFSVLVVERGPLKFHHTRTTPPKGERSETSVFFLDEGAAAVGQVGVGEANPENSLATPYTKEGLAERLLATQSDARLTLEEQGANTLFLALGMLRWRESNEALQDRLAPLVLLPVRLERKSARSFWQIVTADEEPGVNLSLVEKLKDFGIKVPATPELESVGHLEAFFALVGQAVAEKSAWGVEPDRVVLGFFSFGKFLMYRDLDPEVWPADQHPARHPILSGLLGEGFRDPGSLIVPGEDMDARRPPGRTMEVMDADGSQAEALAEVAAGRHLVIQGPPGTGKSQTISNLIAEAVFAGKTVLFVAEKMAALEVVKRRLKNIGLGEICLELHSNKTSKKEIVAQLGEVMNLGRPLGPEGAALVEGLPAHRERLNRYAKAASTPVGPTGVTPYQAIGMLERLKSSPEPPPRIACPAMIEWTPAKIAEASARVQDLALKITDLGVPAHHPFDGFGLTQLLPGDEEKIGAAIREAAAASRTAQDAAAGMAVAFRVAAPADPTALEAWCHLATLALAAPDVRGLPPIGAAWDDAEATMALGLAAKAGLEHLELRRKHESLLASHAWEEDVQAARGDLVSDGTSFWSRLFSSRYRAAKRRVQGLCNPPPPREPSDLVRVTDAILRARQLRGEVEKKGEAARILVGSKWRGIETSWDALAALRDWGMKFRAHVSGRKLPAFLAEWVVGSWDRDALRAVLAQSEQALAQWRKAWTRVATLVAWVVEGRGELPLLPFAAGLERTERWLRELGRLPSYVGYWRLGQEMVGLGLGDLARSAHDGSVKARELPALLERAWAERVVDQAFRERPELREFDVITHEQVLERFRRADAATFAVNRVRLAERHWTSLPGQLGYGQVGLIRHEGAKKARYLPIRRLMEQAGNALQAMKPVFLMSPLSVAAYLPPGGPVFDLVVFDEASQVRPVDAIGSVIRGRQVVVVGDEKQMPPTSFFEILLAEGRVQDEEAPAGNVTQDLQSILGLCTASGMKSRMLRWHYRSRHDSLIAVSNQEFYDNRLVVFPSPERNPESEGLVFRHLPATAYERGTSRTNPLEAQAVVDAVLEHSRSSPHLTLGVVAFSQAQREAIELRIEQLRRKNAEFDAFVASSPEEPFFVKNLENVQGDERDVILISVGYGRDANGAVTMNFGPLNQAGGERRLNVLITRARRKCAVFTNLTADDLDLSRAAGAGVRVLKAFLAYAQKGRLDAPVPAGTGHESDFEEEVHAALQKMGYDVSAQVGSGEFRIDLAVADPRGKGRFLLGIECDGARYHSAQWARDRDRLREAVLRGLGWTIHRIWSTDWFRNREEALRRCVAAIEESKKVRAGPPDTSREPALRRAKDAPPPGPPPPPAYDSAKLRAKLGDAHLAEIDPASLASFIAEIVDREGPLHKEELRRRIFESIDQRAGAKKQAAIDEALALAASRGTIRARGDFLWPREERAVVPRDRSSLPDVSREIGYVCDEECRATLRRVVEEACGCGAEEAEVQAVKVLGIKRNDAALTRLGGLIGGMIADGTLDRRGAGLLLRPPTISRS
jgi:very-short-patch-repair endonuclease